MSNRQHCATLRHAKTPMGIARVRKTIISAVFRLIRGFWSFGRPYLPVIGCTQHASAIHSGIRGTTVLEQRVSS